jgi:hypothetical protein
LAPLRYERLDVPVDDLTATDELPGLLLAAIDRRRLELERELEAVQAVGCRVRLTGHSRIHPQLRRTLASADPTELWLERDGVLWFVAQVIDEAAPLLELATLAQADDLPGLLAQLLRGAGTSEVPQPLLDRALERLQVVTTAPQWTGLPAPELDREAVLELLGQAALFALEELMEQRRDGRLRENA